MTGVYLTHYDVMQNPFGGNLACGYEATEGETFGVTSEPSLTTCPDCLLRLESTW